MSCASPGGDRLNDCRAVILNCSEVRAWPKVGFCAIEDNRSTIYKPTVDLMNIKQLSEQSIFFDDPISGQTKTYRGLVEDVVQRPLIPPRLELGEWYDFLVSLISALLRGRRVVLAAGSSTPKTTNFVNQEPASPLSMVDQPLTSADLGNRLAIWDRIIASRDGRLGLETSGTTGTPKLIWHRLDSLTRGVRQGPPHANDVWGLAYPPTHFAGLQVLFQALANGNPLVRLHGVTPKKIHETIEARGITHLSATPTFYRLLCVPNALVHPHVRRVSVGGERLVSTLADRLKTVFPNARIRDIFAATETGSLLVGRGDGSFSIPSQNSGVIRVRADRLEVHRSLLAESLQLTSPETKFSEDGFFATGDLVEWLDDGIHFRILGRQEEQLNIGGHKVAAGEIEDRLRNWPEVADTRVFGRPNSVIGTLLCCDLVLHQDQQLTVAEVRKRLAAELPTYKIPGLIQFVSALGMTITGKQAKSS